MLRHLKTLSQTAKVVAHTLWDKYFVHYGLPEKILSDQGRHFESNLVKELCELSGIKKLRITSHRPKPMASAKGVMLL